MSGCGVPVTLGNGDVETCGTRLAYGDILAPPLLCVSCHGQRAMAEAGFPVGPPPCRGCGELSRQPDSDFCWACNADLARDLAEMTTWPDHPGSRCTSACGGCGRCGGA